MALATRCTGCGTVFRISTAQAAAKSGMVRCGACRNVFNSLDALVRVEDLDVIEEVVITPATGDTILAFDDGLDDEAIEDASLTGDSELAGFSATELPLGTPTEFEALAAATAGSGRIEPSFESKRVPVVSEWWLPDAAPGRLTMPTSTPMPTPERAANHAHARSTTIPPAIEQPVERLDDSLTLAEPRHATVPPADDLAPLDESIHEEPAPIDEPPAVALESTNPVFMRPEPALERAPRAMRVTLALLSLVAFAALLAQVAYLFRDELAARWSPSRAPLQAACSVLGCSVDYPIHPESIRIESAGITPNGAGANAYQLNALLRNHDDIDLHYPTLELTLTDTEDRPVLRRDLLPRDYLPRQAAAGFPAQSELPIRVDFELSSQRFAGYRLNQVYP